MTSSPAIGWFMLSEADRDAAHRFLSKLSSDGTRDELGFAPIHFAFADRFFPGTSVQHQQLRYVFFVAWAYQELLAASSGGRFDRDRLFEIERRYSRRLMEGVLQLQNSGISGWMKYQAQERPVVRASTIYWTALRSWQIASPIAGISGAPTESQLQAAWPRLLSREDSDALRTSIAELFDGIPPAPAGWTRKTGPLDFELRDNEADYIRRKWRKAGPSGTRPLLSRLAEAGVTTESLWARGVKAVATEEERELLALARRAASIACIARAAYAALVEAKRNVDLELNDRFHAAALPGLVAEHRQAALETDVDALQAATRMDANLTRFVREMLEWVRSDGPLDDIARPLEIRERELKRERAYLLNAKRRAEWRKGVATPLDYRWPVVREMIIRVGRPQ
ncbi:DUF6361 family protein [Sphingobium fuliginis]|uniref:Uncharacterized protein n=1 Tax=Sphingobium fuliginis (strain ATCC 27551) TaxID=336203 RepID=A0ABQ1ETZ0_SPHSA|nr:DUF6361 family protein [Sphingobium fuliginis]RYL99691.1 hypothetical protein EWH10_07500 [Sphingobium fuliginis]GFZ86575.1 hypothetical protein GCM10019071_15050 [Sphingobium fuliginis]